MAFDPTPWFIGGGAHHSPDVARLLAYAATGGKEGVVGPGDLKVNASSSTSVTVDAGACVILNRSAGAQQQSYVGRATSTTGVPVTATGAGGRSDLVVVRVEDPQYSPWPTPNDPVATQYIRPFVVQGVPAGTTSAADLNLGYSAIALARLDIPANTTAITSAMVTDLRRLASPRSQREVLAGSPAAANVTLTSSTFVTFPDYRPQVVVPPWATHAIVLVHVTSIGRVSGDTTGALHVQLGPQVGADVPFNQEGTAGDERITLMLASELDVRAMQGRLQTLVVSGRRATGPGMLKTLTGTRVVYDVQFVERVL